jgi:hypothetical protein
MTCLIGRITAMTPVDATVVFPKYMPVDSQKLILLFRSLGTSME